MEIVSTRGGGELRTHAYERDYALGLGYGDERETRSVNCASFNVVGLFLPTM